jgi:predicted DNA-binding protein (UPF0251 family)
MFIIFAKNLCMPRTEKNRIVQTPPVLTEFKPIGIPVQELEQAILSLDEFEALRLADYIGNSHAEGADEMGVSRPTFTRLIEKARKKIADFIVEGKLLMIDGGNVHFRNNIIRCRGCGQMFKMPIVKEIQNCPSCESGDLLNLAGGFGHGKCCRW